jgi:hypothetical protein
LTSSPEPEFLFLYFRNSETTQLSPTHHHKTQKPSASPTNFKSHAGKPKLHLQSKNRGHLEAQIKMARGNQRDKAREANQKKMAGQVRRASGSPTAGLKDGRNTNGFGGCIEEVE